MKVKSIWKNFMILTLGTLVMAHVDFSYAGEDTTTDETETSDSCVLVD